MDSNTKHKSSPAYQIGMSNEELELETDNDNQRLSNSWQNLSLSEKIKTVQA